MDVKQAAISGDDTKKKKLPKLPNIVEPGFVAPDGGWGWMVIIAVGFSNFCTLSLVLAYGLLFRGHFERLGINISQTTTISNFTTAVMACVGLANGPLYRRFSYRQVSCFGSFLCALSACVLSFMNTFYGILITYAIFYAIGTSLAMSSCSLALNTYFKKKRRMATGLAWTCTGLAPIFIPQLVALWLPIYDVNGTVLLFGGIMFNAFACALLLQPVSKHVKKKSACEENETYAGMDAIKENDKEMYCSLSNGSNKVTSMSETLNNDKSTNMVRKRLSQGFGSQYLSYGDKEQMVDVIMAEGTPMKSQANDGCTFLKLNASNMSLASNKTLDREDFQQTKSGSMSVISNKECSAMASSRLNVEKDDAGKRNLSQINGARTTAADDHEKNTDNDQKQKIDDFALLGKNDDTTESLLGLNTLTHPEKYDRYKESKDSWYKRAWHAFAIFFDLDLLHDPVYVNLMIGITLSHFSDINSFQLTPFILGDYGLEQNDIANIMSVLAIVDVVTRLAIPIIASRIGWENRIFYIVSLVILVASRILLAHLRSYNVLMAIAVLTGAGKAFRQVFVALVIPDHVPLERLPAAIGLQLATTGITYLIFGPVVGWIRDVSGDYTLALHFLNLFSYVVIISWILELSYLSLKRKRLDQTKGRTISA